MSRYSAIKQALAQVAMDENNAGELQSLRRVMLAQQQNIPYYDIEDGAEQFQNHSGPVVVNAWSGIKEDHNTFEEVMQGQGHSDAGYAGTGVYGGKKSIAKPYAEKPGRKLKNVTFRFKNPLVRTEDNWKEPIMPYAWIPNRTQELEQEGMEWTQAKQQAAREYPKMLKEQGYDGFIDAAYENNDVGEVVAYDNHAVEIHSHEPVHGELVQAFIKLAAEDDKKPLPAFLQKRLDQAALNKPAAQPAPAQLQPQATEPIAQVAQPAPTQQKLPSFLQKRLEEKQRTEQATPTVTPSALVPVRTEAPKPKVNISDEDKQRFLSVREELQQQEIAKNNSELQKYVQDNPVPEVLNAMTARGVAIITMPKPGTSLDAIPVVPEGALDEVADMTIEDIGVVSYPDGQPVYAAFGDKTEYEGLLKAAGFKPVVVYFFPRPDAKKGWAQAKRANMYACKGKAGKDAVEAAWSNPNHPVAKEGRTQQLLIDSRRVEMERERNKYQENINRIQRGAKAFTDDGYNEENHRKSYAPIPHKIVAIPTPRKIGLGSKVKQLEYLPYQMAAVSFINERLGGRDDAKPDEERGAVLADSPGIGKAQPLDAPLLTPTGWRTIGELKVGDDVFTRTGEVTQVTGVFPQGAKQTFKVTFTDNTSAECCDEHLWVVNTPYRRKHALPERVLSLGEIVAEGLVKGGKRIHYLPLNDTVQFAKRETPIDPYLLGCILGDGSITQRQVLFSTADEEVLTSVAQALPAGMCVNPTDDRGINYRLSSGANGLPSPLIQTLKELGVMGKSSDDKFVPELYLYNDVETRLQILRGLMDTDGTQLKWNTTQFSSNSKRLADDVAFIVRSLGGTVRQTQKITASGKTHYISTLNMPDSMCPFSLSRKKARWTPRTKYTAQKAFKTVEPSRITECVCISVAHESKTYLTESCTVTHNTMPAIGVISTNPSIKRVLVVCPSVMVPVWIREMKKWLAGDHVRDPQTKALTVKIGRYKKDDPLPDITVMSYESLSKASKDISNPERIGDRAWDYVILDESHRVKDEHSVQACVIMGGRPKRRKSENPLVPEMRTPGTDNAVEYPGIPSKRRLLLTGTPIPSYSWELYANLHFVRPDVFNNEDEFMYQFAVMKAFRTTMWKKNKQTGAPELHRLFITKPVRPQNMTLLNKMLFGGGTYHSRGGKKHFDGIIMRRIHKDLEALGDQYTWPPKGQPQYRAIKEAQDQSGLDARTTELNAIEHKIQEAKNRGANQDELAELEHEYNDKVKVSFQRVAKVRNAIGMRKAPYAATEAALQAKGSDGGRPNQVLVFAYHKNVIETISAGIEQQFKSMGHPEWKVAIVYGATSDKKREETFEQFQSDPNVKVIVASYKVLKEGITLTAANKVIHAELMPNPIDYEQAYARAWRRGQDRQVSETYMWLPKTFDERLYSIASGKYAAANRILNHRLPEPQAA